MDFVEVLFAIVMMFAAGHAKTADDQMRLHQVAVDQFEAASAAANTPILGEAGVEASAIALATVAGHESGFWSKVQDCTACFIGSQWCDRGLSITLYQLRVGSGSWGEYTREQLCESNVLATERALTILNRHRRAHSPLLLFKGYASGGRKAAAWEMDSMYTTALRKAGIFVKYGPVVDANGNPVLDSKGNPRVNLIASWMPNRKPSTADPEAAARPTRPSLDIRLPDPLRTGVWSSAADPPTYRFVFLARPGT